MNMPQQPNNIINDWEGIRTSMEKNVPYKLILICAILAFISISESSYAQPADPKQKLNQCPVYGQYWKSYKWGWYGAKRMVRTPVEAHEILQQFYVTHKGVKIHRIIEGPTFYRAEIMDKNGALVDMVIIDKSTGRIRSIY
jgi:hypothetical protein